MVITRSSYIGTIVTDVYIGKNGQQPGRSQLASSISIRLPLPLAVYAGAGEVGDGWYSSSPALRSVI